MDYLDKKSKQVLKVAVKVQNKLHFIPEGSKLLLEFLPKKYTQELTDDVLWHLHEKGYLQCTSGDCTVCRIYVTYEGQNYSEFRRIELKSFLMRSVLTPIVVSLATTIAALWIKGAF